MTKSKTRNKGRLPRIFSIAIFVVLFLFLITAGLVIYDEASDRASAEEFEAYRITQQEADRPIDQTDLLKLWSKSKKTNLADDPVIREILLAPPHRNKHDFAPAIALLTQQDHDYQEINLAPLILEDMSIGIGDSAIILRWRDLFTTAIKALDLSKGEEIVRLHHCLDIHSTKLCGTLDFLIFISIYNQLMEATATALDTSPEILTTDQLSVLRQSLPIDDIHIRWSHSMLYDRTSLPESFSFLDIYKKNNFTRRLPVYAGDEAYFRRSILRCLRAWESAALTQLDSWDGARIQKSFEELVQKHREPGDELTSRRHKPIWEFMGLFVVGNGSISAHELIYRRLLCYDALLTCYAIKARTGDFPKSLAEIRASLISTESMTRLESINLEIKSTTPLLFTFQMPDNSTEEWPSYEHTSHPETDH